MTILEAFRRCGRSLFQGGLNDSHSGNLSLRQGEEILITRTGSMLHELGEDDVISTAFVPAPEVAKLLSREFVVHRAIYKATDAVAVAHCHPTQAVALGMVEDFITPITMDGRMAMGDGAPVLEVVHASGAGELEESLPPLLAKHPAVLVRGHGVFAVGKDLDQATWRAFQVERTAQLRVAARNLGADLSRLAAKPYLQEGEEER